MIVSVTRLRLRSWWYLAGFALSARGSLREIARAPGFDGGRLLADRQLAFWTVTRWTDEAAMTGWRGAGAHGVAMRRLAGWCDEASVVRWQTATPELPSWEECHRRMRAEGRRTPVRLPSAGQRDFVIPAPRVGRRVVPIRPRRA
jgi:hypothetical protein